MTYFIIIFIIGMLILIHELGHFIAARAAGVPIAKFSIGFGPKLISFTKGGTEFIISAIPLGGYVLPAIDDTDQFFAIPVHKRIILSIGGPAANLILPVFLFAVLNTVNTGISFTGIFIQPVTQTVSMLGKFIASIPMLFSSSSQLSGIVGIVTQGGKFIEADLIRSLNFSIFLSINLAVFNMLPLPALDGGKILFCILEKINPKTVKLQIPLTIVAWAFLLVLMAYATVLDIKHII